MYYFNACKLINNAQLNYVVINNKKEAKRNRFLLLPIYIMCKIDKIEITGIIDKIRNGNGRSCLYVMQNTKYIGE